MVDIFSKFLPVIDPQFSYRGEDVTAALERACAQPGYPSMISTRACEDAYRTMWQGHGKGLPPVAFEAAAHSSGVATMQESRSINR